MNYLDIRLGQSLVSRHGFIYAYQALY